MKLNAPLEVGIAVQDLDLMVAFYRDLLGFHYISHHQVSPDLGKQSTMCSDGYRIVRLQTNSGERIKLVQPGRRPRKPARRYEALAACGLAFLTFIVEDLESTIWWLRERSVPVRTGGKKIEIRSGAYLAFANDPEGNLLEFVEYADLAAYRDVS